MARAPVAARAEAGEGRRLTQLPWNPVVREALNQESSGRGRPEGARRGAGPLQVPASWRSWQRSSNPRDVQAGARGRGACEPAPAPGKGRRSPRRPKGQEGGEAAWEPSGARSAGLAPGGLRLQEDSAGDWSLGSRCVSL